MNRELFVLICVIALAELVHGYCFCTPECGVNDTLVQILERTHMNYTVIDCNGDYGATFTGSIPDSIGNMTSLQFLSLKNAYEEGGVIPSSIGNLINLVYLNIEDVPKLSGLLPDSMNNLSALKHFQITNTGVTADFARVKASFENLRTMSFPSNNFSGELTREFFGAMPNLRMFQLGGNDVYGSLPSGIPATGTLEYFGMANTNISGTIPAFVRASGYANVVGTSACGDLPAVGTFEPKHLPDCPTSPPVPRPTKFPTTSPTPKPSKSPTKSPTIEFKTRSPTSTPTTVAPTPAPTHKQIGGPTTTGALLSVLAAGLLLQGGLLYFA
mmetsp:Transcript_11287/g.18433  ORF Transcript_11287/g.18433 Transcript_11287/m.18433 type:complete len:328 (-) Transcript_11287:1022-2005(-)|eukprot:CAMPEP_0203775890 /NCGR_PEP_ID=MMETSP0099_2-20121227/6397_1 /ASSEMBLY_ACC=CAM_ASM_000209 /TAXON_ID=96639 /ORGANISM=" , Strain NY0313808BC1" /LENGTH=327 /DNA_ID=CAMNT_0050674747 /DNA_START=356 /DNA_END=1339 /DNA_ORIENTATION=-